MQESSPTSIIPHVFSSLGVVRFSQSAIFTLLLSSCPSGRPPSGVLGMIRIAQVWEDGCVQVCAFPNISGARAHLAWIADNAACFAKRPVRYIQGANGRFIKLIAAVKTFILESIGTLYKGKRLTVTLPTPAVSAPRLTFASVKHDLDNVGCTISRRPGGEFRVNFRNGVEATAHYTTDLDDALGTGRLMAKQGNPYAI